MRGCDVGSRALMPDISAAPTREEQERLEASGQEETRHTARPDLHEAQESPPVDEYDGARGREKLDRVIPK